MNNLKNILPVLVAVVTIGLMVNSDIDRNLIIDNNKDTLNAKKSLYCSEGNSSDLKEISRATGWNIKKDIFYRDLSDTERLVYKNLNCKNTKQLH